MTKLALSLSCACLVFAGCGNSQKPCTPAERNPALQSIDSLGASLKWPEELEITGFAGPDLTPSPACLAVAPTGEVFVGVDMIGSLGKDPGRGAIVRLVDCNNDGIMDSHTEFAAVDNPRGIFPLGDQLFVLHTVFEDGFATGMDLVVFEDKDQDGIADGPSKPIIQHISNPKFLQSRGTDHATNGIRMGIDGWIYIAVGDFGFHNATDQEGNKLTMLGGGVVRVRPDGTEMEVYSHGMRNIYDVAIDPFMNIFARGNTNDGGGWNIRFSHQIQSGEYGYPVLFKHFTEEIIPAMVDLGGGSGTGALFMDEPAWPEKYNEVPMMADWGRSQLYIHRVTPSGASFSQEEEEFLKLPQITDLDVDASGRLYLSAWDGAGYSGDSTKGFVVRAVPKDWKYEAFPDLEEASIAELKTLLKSESSVRRLYAQQELLKRSGDKAAEAAWEVASDKTLPLDVRVAGIFTYAQAGKEAAVDKLVKLASEEEVREFALRALADRKPFLENVPVEPFLSAVKDPSARVQVAAIVGLGRLGHKEAAQTLLEVPVPASFKAPAKGEEGPHATPNPEIIPAHVAMQSLVRLNAVNACIEAIGTENSTLALWALRYMHDPGAVDGLIAAYENAGTDSLKNQIITTLARLYQKEAPYDGSWWWSTRPDTHGPYYQPVTWESSGKIKSFLMEQWSQSPASGKEFYANLNGKFRMGITEFGGDEPREVAIEEPKIDLEKIRNQKGQIGKTSIEDIMLAMSELKGTPDLGKKLFVQQGCVACHSVEKGETMKGPFMGQIGSIMNRKQIAESILKPNASISQGFATVQITTKDDKSYMGFVTGESAGQLILRDITGTAHTIKTSDIKERKELETSMMPEGLANSLSYEEFASLITYLSQQKE
ncbi:putative heme-binding domain-containing protein [Anseongella ginsenosidimutans]|uniref:Putative heme-binding domain-containing protein n=1 Tax=Anseongella ginsenosidimutans TaxID=496056 RepID=A0A4R3KZC5_9SPHI|nr:HEAT repeat domain-containing protein [Anseongella ginsenosidimutans]QEC50943.1 c-type cytochrome [Anseongella ginsenosidimutans]TCS90416.1 putative heme-binding domain-containing protein [Anseongella ginsenosidimutans]